MSTIDSKPVKAKKLLNPKLLPIAALLLVILALLFMATPLLRASGGLQRNNNFVPQGSGQTPPRVLTPGGGLGQRFFSGNGTNPRRVTLGGGLLGGITGSILYFVLLLVSVAAAIGMFMTRRWGQVLGIILAVLYFLLGLVSLLPLLLSISFGVRNPISLILGVLHLLLAVSVIVLASIPSKKVAAAPVMASV